MAALTINERLEQLQKKLAREQFRLERDLKRERELKELAELQGRRDSYRLRILDIIEETGKFDFRAAEVIWHGTAKWKVMKYPVYSDKPRQ